MLRTGDALYFSDGLGRAAVPPHKEYISPGPNSGTVDEVENPNAQPGTNNYYAEENTKKIARLYGNLEPPVLLKLDRYFCDGIKSSSTALRIRSGGSRPCARMKSWNFFWLNFAPSAFSVSLRSASRRV